MEQNWPEEADEWIPVPNVEFITADENLIQTICQEYNLDTDYEQMRDHTGVILFLPDAQTKGEAGIQTGDKIALGGIRFRGQDVAFESMGAEIVGIVASPYKVVTDGYLQQRNGITVVVSEGTSEAESVFQGYSRLVVYVRENVEEKIADAIDNCMNEIQSGIQGGVLYSKRSTQEADAIYGVYIHSLGLALACIILVFSGIFIYTHIFSMLKEQKRKYGILRALGVSTGTLARNIFISYMNSMLISAAADAVLAAVFLRDMASLHYRIVFAVMSWCGIFILALFSWILPFILLKRERIRQMIEGK